MNRKHGFTLIELMIVVAIIAIIAAIAIPSLLNARKAGNEASAISSLRTIVTVNEQYRTRFPTVGYSADLTTLNTEGYIDSVLSSGIKSGYDFSSYAPGAAVGGIVVSWTCTADAVDQGRTGDRSFFCDETGVIRFKQVGPGAGPGDPPID